MDDDNRSHFNPVYRNCADFVRGVLNFYYPDAFRRNFFPDAGITTPKQTAYQLERYARKHPKAQLTVFEIPQIPGYRRSEPLKQERRSVAVAIHSRLCHRHSGGQIRTLPEGYSWIISCAAAIHSRTVVRDYCHQAIYSH